MDRSRGDTNRAQLLRKWKLPPDTTLNLDDWSRLSGVAKKYLKKIFDRGRAAAINNPASVRIKGTFQKNPDLKKYPISSRLSPEQWGWARIASFLNKSTTYHTTDNDIARLSNY